MMLLRIAIKSLLHRRLTIALTVFALMISTVVLLGVEHLRQETRNSFNKTISGTDLIVGARTGQVNLLLYSVFRIGNATNNMRWQSYQEIAGMPGVAWTIPMSLGDSHRGYRVLGTNEDYFAHFRFGNSQTLQFASGNAFEMPTAVGSDHIRLQAVLGAEVAMRLGYRVGDAVIISHGLGNVSFSNHDAHPFVVSGILAATGTPVDQTIHVSLAGLEYIHGQTQSLNPESITAFMVGLESPMVAFRLQRAINNYSDEPLMAILPGVALTELWQMMGILERVLSLISALVLVATLLGMTSMMLASQQQRGREMAILRATGASPWFISRLIVSEAMMITMAGMVLGVACLMAALHWLAPWIASSWGVFVAGNPISNSAALYLLMILSASVVLSLLPAAMAYRQSVARGLSRL